MIWSGVCDDKTHDTISISTNRAFSCLDLPPKIKSLDAHDHRNTPPVSVGWGDEFLMRKKKCMPLLGRSECPSFLGNNSIVCAVSFPPPLHLLFLGVSWGDCEATDDVATDRVDHFGGTHEPCAAE